MTKQKIISAYTPSNTDPELLKRVFVQREQLLDRIVDRLSVSMTSGDKHHLLLVGPRGSGKTHLVTLANWELKQNPKLSDSMRIAWLGEDDTFSGLIHFAFGIARSLADEYPNEFPEDFKSPVRGLRQDDAALAVMNSVITNLKHRHLLLITENLDHTFQGLGELGQKKLRAFLQETRRIATLATTQQLFAGVSSRDEAFFGFFDTFHLEPLTVDDAQQLILNIAKEQGKTELIQFLNSNKARYRVRALHHLAGGNHRMYVLLAEFLTQEKLNDLVAAFENLAEEMTPYFQERMRSLPDQQRQLVQCLCDAEGAMTVKQLVEETFIAEGNCSKQLGNLKSKAYVRSEKRGKESYYDMAEPLMRLCLEVKNQRGRPLKLVASFLKAWFPEDKLQDSLQEVGSQSRLTEYCQLALRSDHCFEKLINSNLKAEIEQKMDAKEWRDALALAQELSVSDRIEGINYRLAVACNSFDWNSAIAAFDEILGTPDIPANQKALILLGRGILYRQLGQTDAALADYTALNQMRDAPAILKNIALLGRGLAYSQLGETDAALADYTALIQMPDALADLKAVAWIRRAAIYRERKDWLSSTNDLEAALAQPGISLENRTRALFSLPEPMVAIEPLGRVIAALTIAFDEGDKATDAYGGTPGILISMIVRRGPSDWAGYVAEIAPLYIQHSVAEKLGSGITQSIQFLDEGDFSATQLDLWCQAWEKIGRDVDELQIPLQCLRAAVEVLKSDPPNDRPLFGLPLEIRQLVRPLLQNKLNERDTE